MKKHNFSAGPCILPQEVLKKASEAIQNFNDDDLSLIEISHRSKSFVDVIEKARSLALELLGLENKGYKALFLQAWACAKIAGWYKRTSTSLALDMTSKLGFSMAMAAQRERERERERQTDRERERKNYPSTTLVLP